MSHLYQHFYRDTSLIFYSSWWQIVKKSGFQRTRGMAKRPLIQKGVAELEKLFDQQRGDPQFLGDLIEELSERKTQRAQELRQRAVQAKGTTGQRPAAPIENRETTPDRSPAVAIAPVDRPAPAPPKAVFFILGAPDAQQRGARGWAGGRPNLLNVAATRAKEALYVVGNRSLWKTAGVFQSLDSSLG